MSALRLARGFTGLSGDQVRRIYHGTRRLLISAAARAITGSRLTRDHGGVAATRSWLTTTPGTRGRLWRPPWIAAVIVEPIVGNMGLVQPLPGFLAGLRELTTRYGALLIFDEVMTGFRVAPGGVQELAGVRPDLTTLGKIIGGGLPVGAFGGARPIMERLSPAGPVYQAGTLSGNPLAMAAGTATLEALQAPGVYTHLERLGARFASGMSEVFTKHGVPHTAANVGSMVGFFLTAGPVTDLASAKRSDTALYGRFFHAMLERGVYLAPSQFEAGFLSTAHTDADVERTLQAADDALAALGAGATV